MASIYQRKNSPYWWIKFRNPKGHVERASTGFKTDNGPDKRRAEEMEARKTLAEKQAPAIKAGAWDTWVTDFIKDPYNELSIRTSNRYLSTWRTLRKFLLERKVFTPNQLTYQDCIFYFKWRTMPDIKAGKYKAGKNTAILEFKLLRWLMREAVKQGFSTGNPAREVVLKRAPQRQFCDYSDEQLQEIWKAFDLEPEPIRQCFKCSFAIALLHGVRLNETNVDPVNDVDLKQSTVCFYQKGGKVRVKPLHPQLFPVLKKLQEAGEHRFFPMDKYAKGINIGRLMWGNLWTKFWQRHGFKESNPNGCFHSLRVTVENVLREAQVPKEIREAYLSHEHEDDVNSGYDRVKIREMLSCHAPLNRNWLTL